MREDVDTTKIIRTSRMVSQFTGLSVQRNKAIVGLNAFSHEAGIHQDGVLKHQQTYEIMKPESVGLTSNMLVLGKHSGKHAYRSRLVELGFSDLTDEQIENFVDRFKRLADEKKIVTDADMEAIVSDELYKPEPVWTLRSVRIQTSTKSITLKTHLENTHTGTRHSWKSVETHSNGIYGEQRR